MSDVLAHQPSFARRRGAILAALALVITIGLASRTLGRDLPPLISKHLGDVLWPAMFYLLLLTLRPTIQTTTAALTAFALAAITEFLKLLHTPALDHLRTHPIPALLLGQVFLWSNFIAYATGTLIALALDRACLSPRRRAAV